MVTMVFSLSLFASAASQLRDCCLPPRGLPPFISIKASSNFFWRNEIYYTNALLLLVWSICVVIFVAQKQQINTFTEMYLQQVGFDRVATSRAVLNMAHTKHSRPDSGHGFQLKVLETF